MGDVVTSFSGRIYVEPESRQAIYISLGPTLKGYQIYPSYEPWMAPYVSHETYSKWVQWLKSKLDECPFENSCCDTCCKAYFYGCCCCRHPPDLDDFNQEVCAGFNQLAAESGVTALLDVPVACEWQIRTPKTWIDSKGQPYLLYGNHGPYPGGKPRGYSIVITLAEPISWPPPSHTYITYQPAPQPYFNQSGSNQLVNTQAPPPYSRPVEMNARHPMSTDQLFCTSCGTRLTEGGKFCQNCGSAVGNKCKPCENGMSTWTTDTYV